MNSGDISIPATGLSVGDIYVLLYVYRYWNTEHFAVMALALKCLFHILYLCFVLLACFVLVFRTFNAYYFVKPIYR